MGLRLIYGRAGTGKSEKCYKEISEKIKQNKSTNQEEKKSIKNAIIMEEMYKQGFKDGINLIIQCQKI